MHLLHSRNSWFYSIDFDIDIDFCIWTLQVDGLHVPPFDQHPEGDGSLRAAGLTGEDWQTWLLQVLYQREEFKQSFQRAMGDPLDPFQDLSSLQALEPCYPHSAWSGSDAVRERLIKLWEQYESVCNLRKGLEPEFGRALDKEERKSGKRLYDELRPYHRRLPPLSIYLVAYEHPLDYLVPPATFIMTVQEGQPNPQEFRERVLAVVAELAILPDQRKRKSLYTRVVNAASQIALAYRKYGRKPVPPSPPRQEIPRLADPARQIVLETLGGDHSSYGSANQATLQFLREKKRPGWQLYEVLFQEIDGEQHRVIFVLQQYEDGSWHCSSYSSSSDMQTHWSKIFGPVRDHPLLLLGVKAGGADDQHFLEAYGDVIDNGFHVERVRLITKARQIFEDTVENGLVFFACEQKQPIPLPMQAELYNHEGKLVWRQTVPDNGLPPWLKVRRG